MSANIMYYCVVECDKDEYLGNEIINNYNLKNFRYQKSLFEHIKFYRDGYEIFGYKFKLIFGYDKNELLSKITKDKTAYYFVKLPESISKDENKKDEAFGFVRKNNKEELKNSDHFSCGSCELFFDKLNGVVLINKRGSIKMGSIIKDYILALSYFKKIQEFQTKAIEIKRPHFWRYIKNFNLCEYCCQRKKWNNFVKDLEFFEMNQYFSNPIMLNAYQSYNMWKFIYKNFNLEGYHNDMLRQRANILKDNRTHEVATKAYFWAAASAIIGLISLMHSVFGS